MALRFEWDANKAKANFAKHRISFEEASTVFGDPRSLTGKVRGHQQARRVRYRFSNSSTGGQEQNRLRSP